MILKQLVFDIEVFSEEDFERASELMRVKLANLELSGLVKIKELEKAEQQ